MWKRAMRATDVGVEAAASPQCMVPLQARLELVNAIGQLNVGHKKILIKLEAMIVACLDKHALASLPGSDQCHWPARCSLACVNVSHASCNVVDKQCMMPKQARLDLINVIGKLNMGHVQ